MKYYISLAIIIAIGLALYEKPVEAPPVPRPANPVTEPVGAQEPVGAKFEPPAGSF